MFSRGLVKNGTFIFYATNYGVWKFHMLNHFRAMDPNMELIVDVGFSSPMVFKNLSLGDRKNVYLNAQGFDVVVNAFNNIVTFSIISFESVHEL
jgi:hypothetical protein